MIDHMLPGAAASDTYIEFKKTSESGTGLLQNSSSWYESFVLLSFEGGGLKSISTISQTVFDSFG